MNGTPDHMNGPPKENLECRKPHVKLRILIQLYSCMYSLYNCRISRIYLCWDNGRMSTSRKEGEKKKKKEDNTKSTERKYAKHVKI